MDNLLAEDLNKLGQHQVAFGSNARKIVFVITCFSLLLAVFGSVTVIIALANFWLAFVFLPFDALLLAAIISTVRRLHWQTMIFSNGLLLRRNKKQTIVLWEDVKSFSESVNYIHGLPYDHQIGVQLHSGKGILFDSTSKGVDIVGQRLRDNCNPLILSRAVQCVNNNEPIEFGDLMVRPNALEVTVHVNVWKRYKKSISWTDVEDIEIEEQRLSGPVTYSYLIREKGKKAPWHSLPVPFVPNTEVFFFIVKKILGKP